MVDRSYAPEIVLIYSIYCSRGMIRDLQSRLERCTNVEQYVLWRRIEGDRLKDIGKALGWGEARVSQVISKALSKYEEKKR